MNSRPTQRQYRILLVSVTITALVAAACGGGSSSSATTAATTATTSALSGGAPSTTVIAANPSAPPAHDFLVTQESVLCPLGEPAGAAVVRLTNGQSTVVTQGGILNMPRGINLDGSGNAVFADGLAGLMRLTGTSGAPTRVAFQPPYSPRDVVVDPQGNYYVAEWPTSGGRPAQLSEFYRAGGSGAGGPGALPAQHAGTGQTVSFQSALPPGGGPGHPPGAGGGGGQMQTGAGGGRGGGQAGNGTAFTPAPGENTPAEILKITPAGQVTVFFSGAPLQTPHGLTMDAAGNLIVADIVTGIVKITPGGQASVVAAAHFNPAMAQNPQSAGNTILGTADVAVDAAGNYIAADVVGAALYRITPSGQVTVVHRGAPFSTVNLQNGSGGPRGVVVEPNGSYDVVDQDAQSVFHVTPDGQVTTVAQGGAICDPADLVILG